MTSGCQGGAVAQGSGPTASEVLIQLREGHRATVNLQHGHPAAGASTKRSKATAPPRYNLGVRGQTSADVMARWRSECAPRFADRAEQRLVVQAGGNDVRAGITVARSRLNLANILDEASSSGIATYVVGLTPCADAELNAQLEARSEALADVCHRRGVTYVDCFRPLIGHDQWQSDLAAGDGVHPGQAGYGLIAWLVLHAGWHAWLGLDA